jgi:hypothetical protein
MTTVDTKKVTGSHLHTVHRATATITLTVLSKASKTDLKTFFPLMTRKSNIA